MYVQVKIVYYYFSEVTFDDKYNLYAKEPNLRY